MSEGDDYFVIQHALRVRVSGARRYAAQAKEFSRENWMYWVHVAWNARRASRRLRQFRALLQRKEAA